MTHPDGDVLFGKTVPSADRVTTLPDLGDGGALVAGEHLLQTPRRTVSAGSAVLWSEGGRALRLDASGRSGAELVQLAQAIAGA